MIMSTRTIAFTVLACAALGLSSCRSTMENIRYKEVVHYFVRNDVADYSPRLIQSDEELGRYFGAAAVMGKDGMPTDVDFAKYNVVAIIEPETYLETSIRVSSIRRQGDKVIVRYTVDRTGNPGLYSTVPFLLLRIEKRYGSDVVFVEG